MKINRDIKAQALAEIREFSDKQLGGKLDKAIKKSKQGVIFVYEFDEIMGEDTSIFVQDGSVELAGYEQFFNGFIDMLEAENDIISEVRELVGEYYEYMRQMSYVFYRLKDEDKTNNLEEAIEIAKEFSEWMPRGIIVNGGWNDTKNLGNAVYF